MPDLRPLSGIQVGLEAAGAPGTAVAATVELPFESGGYTPMRTRKLLEEPRGVLADYDDVLVRQASAVTITQSLDFTHALLALLCGIQAETGTQVTGSATDYEWEFVARQANPQPVRTATFEVFQGDGTVQDYTGEFPYGICTEFTINIPAGEEICTIDSTWVGRAEAIAAPTTGLSLIAAREIIPASLFSVSLDDTWAGLGAGALGGDVRSATLQVNTGITPRYNKAGRAALDMTGIYRGRITGSLQLDMDVDAPSAAIIAAWRSGDRRYARLRAAGTSDRYFQADSSLRFLADPEILSADGDHSTVALSGMLRVDPTGGLNNLLAFAVRNEIATWG